MGGCRNTVVVHRKGSAQLSLISGSEKARKFRDRQNKRAREQKALAELERLFSRLGEKG